MKRWKTWYYWYTQLRKLSAYYKLTDFRQTLTSEIIQNFHTSVYEDLLFIKIPSLSIYSFIKLSISYWTLNSWCNNIHTCLKGLDCWKMSGSSYILTKLYLCSSVSSLHSFLYMKKSRIRWFRRIIKTVWRINSLGLPLIVIPKNMVLLDSVLSSEWLSYIWWKITQTNSWWFDSYFKWNHSIITRKLLYSQFCQSQRVMIIWLIDFSTKFPEGNWWTNSLYFRYIEHQWQCYSV